MLDKRTFGLAVGVGFVVVGILSENEGMIILGVGFLLGLGVGSEPDWRESLKDVFRR